MDLLLVRDILTFFTIVFSLLVLFRSEKIKKEKKDLEKQYEYIVELDNVHFKELRRLKTEVVPNLELRLKKAEKEAARLAASKSERDVDTIVKALKRLIGEKVE